MGRESIAQKIRDKIKDIPGEFRDMKEVFCLDTLIAERKAFLSKQKLSYTARFKVDETAKVVTFTERLKEERSDLGAGSLDETGRRSVSVKVLGLPLLVDWKE